VKHMAILGVAASLLASAPAIAQRQATIFKFSDGNDLYRLCTAPGSGGACIGYIEGVADALGQGDSIAGNRVCLPDGVNGHRLREVVLDDLERETKEARQISGAVLVTLALAIKYPCHH